MFNRHIIEHVCFLAKVPLNICFEIGVVSYSIFNVKYCEERKNKDFLFINFRLAVDML
jgi:hypothetical protein